MNRKNFIKGLAAATIVAPIAIRSCTGENFAQQDMSSNVNFGKKYKWKMTTTWPPNFPVLGEACQMFADLVKQMSGGRMEIKVYGGGELVPALEAFDAVRSGAAECGSGAAYYWAGKSTATQFFASVPFGMNAQQLNAWIMCGGGLELWKELYAGFGLVPMLGGNTGVQMGGWFNKEINSIGDIQGLKMRMPGLGGKVLEKAGGAAVLLPGGEIYTGLETGVIDATEWVGPYHDYKMGFHQISKYYYTPGWHECGTALEFFFNKEKFDALPADIRVMMETAASHLNIWMLSELETKNSIYLQKLIHEEKVEIRQYPPEVLRALKDITEETIAEIVAKDPESRKIYAAYDDFRKKASTWSNLTEKVFYNNIQI